MPVKVRPPHAGDSTNTIVHDVVEACELLLNAEITDRESATQLLAERAVELLRVLGYRVAPSRISGGPPRGDEPAFRIETGADYAVRDVRLAAGIARSRARRQDVGLCTAEPLEEDPMGILLDLLDLEVPMSELKGAIDLLDYEQNARALSASERQALRTVDHRSGRAAKAVP